MIMTFLAQSSEARVFQAREIAQQTSIALPTVSKLLKTLVRHNLLASHRGIHGGYQLNISPESISVVDLISVLEGPIAITECNLGHAHCPTQSFCGLRAPWQHINGVITKALSAVKLSDLVNSSHFSPQSQPSFGVA